MVLAMIITFAPVSAFALERFVYLPTSAKTVEAEAFAGNTAIERVFIPENVSSIGSRAFAGCTGLQEIIINRKDKLEIAEDAFDGVNLDSVRFVVLPDTPAELFCLAHGYICDRAEPGNSHYDRIQQLVAEHGGTSALQSGADAMRLIVRRASGRLPDISMYHPIDIVHKDDIFVIQFEDSWDVADCMTALRAEQKERGDTEDYQQYDQTVSASFFGVQAAGVIDPADWGTDDPMGFDIYAPFVAKKGSGSVKIAVIDSGVRNVGSYVSRLDTVNARNMTDDGGKWYNDSAAHGSFVAAVIDECVGENDITILPIRVVNNYTLAGTSNNRSGNIDYALVGDAIDYAVECGADIINLSMAFPSCAHVEHCIDRALEKGVTVVTAAGNKGQTIDAHVFPANLPQVVTVAGIDSSYTLIGNYGPTIDYCAPYEWYQTKIGDSSGTSFSAPTIAAALALVKRDPYHTVGDLNQVCYHDDGSGTGGNAYGHGMPHLEELADVPAEYLVFDSNLSSELIIDQELELNYHFYPADTTDQRVTINSSDESILRLSEDGKRVKALRQGTATLKLQSVKNPDLVSMRTFTVVQPVEKITLTGVKEKLVLGKTMELKAIVSPADATTKTVEWYSTNEKLVSVSADGKVTVAPNVTEADLKNEPVVGVYARATDGYKAQSELVSFKVVAIPDAESIKLIVSSKDVTNSSIAMAPGESVQIVTEVKPDDADQSVEFTVDNNHVDVSADGTVKALSDGTAHINVYVKETEGVVASLEGVVRVMPASIEINGNTTINEGQTTALAANVLPQNTTNKNVTWSSSNTGVATISTSGVVTGVTRGQAIITATSTADPAVTKSITVTVRHPFTLNFNANSPESGLTPSLSSSSKSVFSGETVGSLPSASCNYYDFLGWFTAPSGGERRTDSSIINTTASSVTLYAHWTPKGLSGWVLTSAVPNGARITQTSYSYRESTESTVANMSGWVHNGDYWKQTGGGSKEYASFPSTYETGHWTYNELNGSAFGAYENASNKRTVSNTHTGYVYWHWAYNAAYYNNTNRWISDRKQSAGSSRGLANYAYVYFYAFKSTTNAPTIGGFTYTWGANAKHDANATTYNCSNCLPGGADTSSKSGLNNPRFLRLDYYTSTYTDYQKIYKYYRDLNYQSTKPGGNNISNLTTYVKYQPQ